jgi:hypothetical protein
MMRSAVALLFTGSGVRLNYGSCPTSTRVVYCASGGGRRGSRGQPEGQFAALNTGHALTTAAVLKNGRVPTAGHVRVPRLNPIYPLGRRRRGAAHRASHNRATHRQSCHAPGLTIASTRCRHLLTGRRSTLPARHNERARAGRDPVAANPKRAGHEPDTVVQPSAACRTLPARDGRPTAAAPQTARHLTHRPLEERDTSRQASTVGHNATNTNAPVLKDGVCAPAQGRRRAHKGRQRGSTRAGEASRHCGRGQAAPRGGSSTRGRGALRAPPALLEGLARPIRHVPADTAAVRGAPRRLRCGRRSAVWRQRRRRCRRRRAGRPHTGPDAGRHVPPRRSGHAAPLHWR